MTCQRDNQLNSTLGCGFDPLAGRRALSSAAAIALAAGLVFPAHAQSSEQAAADSITPVSAAPENSPSPVAASPDQTIVVTGTFIRGIAPVGTTVVGISEEDVKESGAKSPIELLADVPEVSNFFNRVNTPTTNFGSPANRPLIRGLPTLMLLNGYRVVGTGLIQTSPEPTQIAPGSIARVEVIPGSGSSIYGSDAIGGVINFITRKNYDGIELAGRFGIGNDFTTQDGQVTVGRAWSTGSLLMSYAYAHHGRIKNYERDYFTQDLTRFGGSDFRTNACPDGNITVGTVTYALPSRTPGVNKCDRTLNADFYPKETRHNVLVALNQELGSSVQFDATAYFARRQTFTETATASTSLTITNANPFFSPIGTETSHTVSFAYDPVFGPVGKNAGKFDSWGVTPEFTVNLSDVWRVKVGGNYGHSWNYSSAYEINAAAQSAAINATTIDSALDPYDLTKTNPAVLAGIANSRTNATTTQNLYQARVVADGTLFQFGGNDARLAVGAEYLKNDVHPTLEQGPIPGFVTTSTTGSRHVESLFGELVIPLFGPQNHVGGLYSLTVSGSARYDHYSDFGGTFNPKFALTWEPFDGLRFIGNWGKNFHAPELTDTANTVDSRNQFIAASPFQRPTDNFFANIGRPTILIAGGNPDLKPETSTTWSFGFDYKPAFVPDLSIGADYYNTKFRNRIFLVLPFPPANITNPALASFFHWNPTLAEAQALLAGRRNDGFTSVDALYSGAPSTYPYLILDARRANLGAVNLEGIDVRANYRHPVGDVTLSFGVNASYLLTSESQQVPNTPFNNDLSNGTPRLSLSANAGFDYAGLSARATYFRSGSYPVLNVVGQDRVDSFNVVDLFLSYDLEKLGIARTQITLNVDNLFNTIPPFFNAGTGRANGSTLGRVFTLGVRTSF